MTVGPRRRELWSSDPRRRPWPVGLVASATDLLTWRRDLLVGAWCNICGWRGLQFRGGHHSELAHCPTCRSVARDRFLYRCWTERVPHDPRARVLETSPRLGAAYRRRMGRLVDYRTSDFEEKAHRGTLRLDLQAIDLPDASLDVVITSHTLEHVPDPGRALAELHRVLRPGGSLLLMVPLPQAQTLKPTSPEYHGDDTLVHWRFGWDLADQVRAAGFDVETLVTADLLRRAQDGDRWGYIAEEVDSDSVLAGARSRFGEMVAVADLEEGRLMWLEPSFFYVVWHGTRPA